jgi:hypothetical protein
LPPQRQLPFQICDLFLSIGNLLLGVGYLPLSVGDFLVALDELLCKRLVNRSSIDGEEA